jgi:hypothetical protein
MDAAARQHVRDRAGNRCEYCGLRQEHSPLASLQIEHIIPKKHGGSDESDNLALACIDCNLHKGPNLAGRDPETGQTTELFNPRTDRWADHFERSGPYLVGKTPVGRTTIYVLDMNGEERVELRTLVKGPT